ncbi:MAG: SMC-Scp complex subunit ScpB [Armatimonadota bacterium]
MDDDLLGALECILFVSEEPLPASRVAEVLQVDAEDVPELVNDLKKSMEGRGLTVVELAGGYALATKSDYAEYVQTLLEPDPERLSRQALEVLAIIAYRQPITRPEIDELRGVNSSGVMNTLLEKNLVRVCGRLDAPGRPYLLETTDFFLSAFGLKDLEDLPKIDLPVPPKQPAQQHLEETSEGADDATTGKNAEDTNEDDRPSQ